MRKKRKALETVMDKDEGMRKVLEERIVEKMRGKPIVLLHQIIQILEAFDA